MAVLLTAASPVGPTAGPLRGPGPGPGPDGETTAVWLYLDATALSRAEVSLSDAALARRAEQGIALFDNDRRIPDDVLRAITATGATIRTPSRWLRAVSVDATAAQLAALKRLGFVKAVAPVASVRYERRPAPPSGPSPSPAVMPRPSAATQDSAFWGPNYRALTLLNIPRAHDLGFTGRNVRVAIFDTGFEPQHESLRRIRVGAQYDFINRDTIVWNQPGEPSTSDQERQGTWVWSLLGGLLPGYIVGPAYNAVYYLAKVDEEPWDTRLDEDRWVAAAEWADSLGVQVISSSVTFRYEFSDRLAYPFPDMDGNTTPTTRAADEAARRGILVVQSIGNTPPVDGSLVAPSDADSVIAVGAVDYQGNPVMLGQTTSGRGPTARGAIKPELVAPAVDLVAASSANPVGRDVALAGTTFATPLIAAAAAVFLEAWPAVTPYAVRRALMSAGSNARTFNNTVGWGIPDVAAAIMMPDGLVAASVTEADLNGVIGSVAPTFRWDAVVHPATRPIRFVLEVARDTLFTQLLASDTVVDAFSLQLQRPLAAGTRLYWRVRAMSPTGIQRVSDIGRALDGDAFEVPDWVRLLTLVEAGEATDSTHPTLRWDAVLAPAPVGPFTFDVEVLANSDRSVVQRVRGLRGDVRSYRLADPLSPNAAYVWRVIARLPGGLADTVQSVQPFHVNVAEAPSATLLYQNFPNPFPRIDLGMSRTNIWFDLAEDSRVELSVHDLRGRLVRSLIPVRGCAPVVLEAGIYGRAGETLGTFAGCATTRWDGRGEDGEKVPNGVYVLRLVAGGKVQYRRMLYQGN